MKIGFCTSRNYIRLCIFGPWSNIINQSLRLKLFGVYATTWWRPSHMYIRALPINWRGKISIESNNKKSSLWGNRVYRFGFLKNLRFDLRVSVESLCPTGKLGPPVRWTADGHASTINTQKNINNLLKEKQNEKETKKVWLNRELWTTKKRVLYFVECLQTL